MEFKDYYKIMGLSSEASQDDIKRTYRKLARKYHPDVSKEKDAEAKFKEVGEAYEVLKDAEKRSRYDALRQQGWRGGENFQAPPNWQSNASQGSIHPEDVGAFSDFFESIFGYQPRGHQGSTRGYRSRPTRGEDIYYVLEVSPKDSYAGGERTIEIPMTQMTDEGRVVQKNRTIKVKIPKGVVSGQQIRLRGQGGPGFHDGQAGDLYLEIRLHAEEPYQIEGKNITLYLPVSPWEAALGSKVKAPTLGGNIEIKIPPNSQTGTKLRLKGRGLPGKTPGDQYIVLQVVTPPATTPEAKELYEQMAEKIEFNPREKLGIT